MRVTLVSLGEILLPDQTSWMDHLHGLEYHPTAFRLDWMHEGELDFEDSSAFLSTLVHELKPDLLHLNQPCYGSLAVDVPRVVVAPWRFISWWKAVHGHEPKPSRWLSWYRAAVSRGLTEADAVVAPTVWMLDTLHACYARPVREEVIYHGRNPIFFNPYVTKEDAVLSVGGWWIRVTGFTFNTISASHAVCIVGLRRSQLRQSGRMSKLRWTRFGFR